MPDEIDFDDDELKALDKSWDVMDKLHRINEVIQARRAAHAQDGTVVVVELAGEGCGETVYGRQVDGAWSFWHEDLVFPTNETEECRIEIRESVPDLFAILPENWWMMDPIEVHPEFVDQLRSEFEQQRDAARRQAEGFDQSPWSRIEGQVTIDAKHKPKPE